jgi:hypothetical protein
MGWAAGSPRRSRRLALTALVPYTDVYLEDAGVDAPKFTDKDLKIIATLVEFVGINVYRPNTYVAPSTSRRATTRPRSAGRSDARLPQRRGRAAAQQR